MPEKAFHAARGPCSATGFDCGGSVYKDLLGLRTNGWLGSDVGESIVLSDKKTLWLFGDTFIGPLSNGVRVAGARMINSTIACRTGRKRRPIA